MQSAERRHVTPLPILVFGVDRLNRGRIVQPSGKLVGRNRRKNLSRAAPRKSRDELTSKRQRRWEWRLLEHG